MEGDSISLIIIVLCVIMSAYFSATETAFSSLNRIRIKNMAEKGDKKAQLVLNLSENFDNMLSTILIGNNIVNILSASLATVLFVNWLGNEAGPSVSTAVTTVVVLIFGEITPKSIAKESPEKFAKFSAPFLRVLMFILTPFNFLFSLWKKLMSVIIKSDDSRSITEEELITIVEEAEQEGGIDEEESTLIRSAIEFSEVEAKDVYTPRIQIEGVPEDATKDEVARMFTETGYSRLPVYRESLDHIIGVIYHKDFHNYVYNTDKDISSIIRPAIFVTPNKKIDELLKELQQQKSHIAFILDEYAGTMGLVTLEDIVEELVGEIWDEHDEIVQEIVQISENEYHVLGSADIEEVFEKFDISEEIDVMTASGWVMNVLGRIPNEGDSFVYKNLDVTVLSMDEKRVGKISIVVKENTEE
ncbi:MAG: HlyC/CorC family transporter [Oscillospiraceae bacterium]|nr:HlyC/CorC family transporter [Oscillospiraceae bacterium]